MEAQAQEQSQQQQQQSPSAPIADPSTASATDAKSHGDSPTATAIPIPTPVPVPAHADPSTHTQTDAHSDDVTHAVTHTQYDKGPNDESAMQVDEAATEAAAGVTDTATATATATSPTAINDEPLPLTLQSTPMAMSKPSGSGGSGSEKMNQSRLQPDDGRNGVSDDDAAAAAAATSAPALSSHSSTSAPSSTSTSSQPSTADTDADLSVLRTHARARDSSSMDDGMASASTPAASDTGAGPGSTYISETGEVKVRRAPRKKKEVERTAEEEAEAKAAEEEERRRRAERGDALLRDLLQRTNAVLARTAAIGMGMAKVEGNAAAAATSGSSRKRGRTGTGVSSSESSHRRRSEKEEDQELMQDALEEVDSMVGIQLRSQPSNVTGTMRAYQLEGLNWMIRLYHSGVSGILADEMGLGKTLQSISLLAYLHQYEGIRGPHLVLVPLSTLGNWEREFARWCPSIRVLKFHGTREERAAMVQQGMLKPDHWDVLLTSYEMAGKEKASIQKIDFNCIVVDEAHRLKNEESLLSQIVRLFSSKFRLLLTGTPLQNNLHELWALLNFLLPGIFSSSEEFDAMFATAQTDQTVSNKLLNQLHAVLRPFMLRRMKANVAQDLPPKKETILFVGMSELQAKLYKSILERDIEAVLGRCKEKSRLMNMVMQLRKACFTAQTPVNLSNGLAVDIDQVQKGSSVLAYDTNAKGMRGEMVSAQLDQGVRQCIQLLFSDGRTVTCTPDHPILTANGDWVEAKDLTNQHVAISVEYPRVNPYDDEIACANSSLALPLSLPLPLPQSHSTTGNRDIAANLAIDPHSNANANAGPDTAPKPPSNAEALMSFALLMGYYTAAGMTRDEASADDMTKQPTLLPFTHRLDADRCAHAIRIVTGQQPRIHHRPCHSMPFSLTVPDTLVSSMEATLTHRHPTSTASPSLSPSSSSFFPALLLSPSCPLPFIREYLSALFSLHADVSMSNAGQRDQGQKVGRKRNQTWALAQTQTQTRTQTQTPRCSVPHAHSPLPSSLVVTLRVPNLPLLHCHQTARDLQCLLHRFPQAINIDAEGSYFTYSDHETPTSVSTSTSTSHLSLSVTDHHPRSTPSTTCTLHVCLVDDSAVAFHRQIGFRLSDWRQLRLTAGCIQHSTNQLIHKQQQAIIHTIWQQTMTSNEEEKGDDDDGGGDDGGKNESWARRAAAAKRHVAGSTPLHPAVIAWQPEEACIRSHISSKQIQCDQEYCVHCASYQLSAYRRCVRSVASSSFSPFPSSHPFALRPSSSHLPISSLLCLGHRSVGLHAVYDLTVPASSSFTAHGLVVHNSSHPYLFEGVEDRSLPAYGEHLIYNSGKMAVLDKLLARFKQQGSRVLIFSQMTRTLDILEDYCGYRQFAYCRIDGNTVQEDRERSMREFNAEGSEKFVFLLSTRAGGLGINLNTADIVILFDSDWNPQMDLQAMDRAHRIGQKKHVYVYRLITEHTIEEKIIERAEIKLRLDAMVIQQGRALPKGAKGASVTGMSADDVSAMIRYGADHIFRQTGSTISDADIDNLLATGEQRTQQLSNKLGKHVGLLDLSLDGSAPPSMMLSGEEDELSKQTAEELERAMLLKLHDSMGKRDRSKAKTYDVNAMYREMSAAAASSSHQPRSHLPKPYKVPRMPDYQLWDSKRIIELSEKERAWYDKHQFDTSVPAIRGGLTQDEQAEMERLLSEGFSDWKWDDYTAFISACKRYGGSVDALDKVVASMSHRQPRDSVRRYHSTFFRVAPHTSGFKGALDRIAKGEARIRKYQELEDMLEQAMKTHQTKRDVMENVQIRYTAVHKGKGFSLHGDRLLLYWSRVHGYGEWGKVWLSIQQDGECRLDYFLRSRMPNEIGKRVESIIRVIKPDERKKKESKREIMGKSTRDGDERRRETTTPIHDTNDAIIQPTSSSSSSALFSSPAPSHAPSALPPTHTAITPVPTPSPSPSRPLSPSISPSPSPSGSPSPPPSLSDSHSHSHPHPHLHPPSPSPSHLVSGDDSLSLKRRQLQLRLSSANATSPAPAPAPAPATAPVMIITRDDAHHHQDHDHDEAEADDEMKGGTEAEADSATRQHRYADTDADVDLHRADMREWVQTHDGAHEAESHASSADNHPHPHPHHRHPAHPHHAHSNGLGVSEKDSAVGRHPPSESDDLPLIHRKNYLLARLHYTQQINQHRHRQRQMGMGMGMGMGTDMDMDGIDGKQSDTHDHQRQQPQQPQLSDSHHNDGKNEEDDSEVDVDVDNSDIDDAAADVESHADDEIGSAAALPDDHQSPTHKKQKTDVR